MIETAFTPFAGLAGGILIGFSAVVLMATAGRILGASGIFGGLLTLRFDGDFRRNAIFILGLVIGTWLTLPLAANAQNIGFQSNPALLILGGVLVGLGVTWGNGCTSGHGICGLARFSPRSMVATIVFMAVAILTVIVTRHFI